MDQATRKMAANTSASALSQVRVYNGTKLGEREAGSMIQQLPLSIMAAGYVPLDIVRYRDRIWHAAGGTAGNVAAILSFLGWRSTVVVDLGDDLAGHRVKDDLQKAKVSVEWLRLVKSRTTPRLIHEIDGQGHRYRFSCPKCEGRFPTSGPLLKDRAEELVELRIRSNVFVFDRLNVGTVLLAEHYRSTGALVVFEPSLPGRRILTERALDAANVVKQSSDRDAGLDSAEAREGQIWIVTKGSRGARFRIGAGRWCESKPYISSVVDAGGAGDWMTAGLIYALHLRHTLAEDAVTSALSWAQALAAVSCEVPGARGLAHQQPREAVIGSADSLQQQEGTRTSVAFAENPIGRRGVHTSACDTCLQVRS